MTNIGEAVYNDNVNIIDERYGNGILMSPSLIVYVIHFTFLFGYFAGFRV